MLLEGPGNAEHCSNEAALSLAQLIVFNSIKRPQKRSVSETAAIEDPASVRHPIARETRLPIYHVYVGLILHYATWKKKLVDKCCNLGLSIPYNRVLQLSNKITNSVCNQYRAENLVCPPVLCKNLFAVAVADNIDHNLSSVLPSLRFMEPLCLLFSFLLQKAVLFAAHLVIH